MDRIEAYADKGNIITSKRERSFLRNLLVVSEFFSQCYTHVSWNSPITLSLRNLRRATFHRIEAYADKGNIIS